MADKPTVTVTDQSFATEVLDSKIPVLVDFWAIWCGPCKTVAPVLEQIAAEHAEKITVAKLDVDKNPSTSRKYKIMSIPTLMLFSEGKVVKTIIGSKPKAALLAELAEYI